MGLKMEMFRLPSTLDEVQEKLNIVKKYGLYPEDELMRCLDSNKELIKKIKKDFDSDEYGFDDIYKVKMFVANYLMGIDNEEKLDSDYVKELRLNLGGNLFNTISKGITDEPSIHLSWVLGIPQHNSTIEKNQKLNEIGFWRAKKLAPQIRARLALLELFTIVSYEDFIPKLLKVCPLYLSCPIVARKISEWTYEFRKGDESKKKYISRTFTDRRISSNKISYRHWSLFHRYYLLKKHLEVLAKVGKRDLRKKFIKDFLTRRLGLKKECEDFLLEENYTSPKKGAMEIMFKEGRFENEDAFNRTHEKIESLLKKHPMEEMDIFTGQVADDMIIKEPSKLESPDLWFQFFDNLNHMDIHKSKYQPCEHRPEPSGNSLEYFNAIMEPANFPPLS